MARHIHLVLYGHHVRFQTRCAHHQFIEPSMQAGPAFILPLELTLNPLQFVQDDAERSFHIA